MASRTLLIVNDDFDSCTFLEDQLKSKNITYTIKSAQDSSGALKLAEAFKPAVAIVDRNLRNSPGTGLNLALHLKRKYGTDCILTSSEYFPLSHQDEKDIEVTQAKAAFNTPMRNYDVLSKTIDTLMGSDVKRKAK